MPASKEKQQLFAGKITALEPEITGFGERFRVQRIEGESGAAAVVLQIVLTVKIENTVAVRAEIGGIVAIGASSVTVWRTH